ncbi:hypothetical protein ACFWUQ_29050 [Streptomyces sp. NPDC058662]|uniref:hypothetical protein n=1 Tax=Streptomyces sp. NPDC058662 TaxID=3346583 RepID=UPI0036593CFF
MTVRHAPVRRRGAAGAAGAAALLVAALGAPAHAAAYPAEYADPTISLSSPHLSGAVGAHGDSGVTVDIEQAGLPAGLLRLRVVSSTNPAVAGAADVRQERTRTGDRRLTVRARAPGCTDLTLEVTGRGGRTATAVLTYAASARASATPAPRCLTVSFAAAGSSDPYAL